MTQTDLIKHFRPPYDVLQAELARCKSFCPERHPQHAEYARVLEAIEGLIIMRNELQRLLPPPEEPVQVALLDVPKRGGY